MNNDNCYNLNRISLIAKGQGAFIGAAVGDALGWPQEPEAKRVDQKNVSPTESLINGFQQWVRKSGGQYYPHQEVILAGEYSDDTQLILCTARSLLYGENWWHYFTQRELPTWTCYERGGGGATKRSARQWLAGQEPWSSPEKDKKQYFDAGGNGVAMRILPHCLLGATENNFGNIAKNIVANGVCTHGHPRALVGSLAYGFAVWIALRETGTLTYGAIIEKVLSGVKSWSLLPNLDDIFPTWRDSAFNVSDGKYEENWQKTITEILQFLEQCQDGMKQGALSIEREILTKLGCFDKKIKGSGTVTAAAAIFLASRYAAAPFNGVIEAGFAYGADTDTLASMTGGILGAIAGIEWLGNYAEQVQDARYLKNLSECLARNEGTGKSLLLYINRTTKAHLDSLVEKLEVSQLGQTLLFPDGREAQLSVRQEHQPLSKTTMAVSWKLITTDCQSLYVKKISRIKNEASIKTNTPNIPTKSHIDEVELQAVKVISIAVKLPVRNMEKSRFFYERVLGLKVEKEADYFVKCGSILLVKSDSEKKQIFGSDSLSLKIMPTICIEVESLELVYDNVCKFEAKILKEISGKEGCYRFTCIDPDGNAVEVDQIVF